jgi:thymidine kinase
MFAGKTTELIRRMRCSRIAGQKTMVLKPRTDTRSGLEIVTHEGVSHAAKVVEIGSPQSLPQGIEVLGIDEAQFLGEGWVDALDKLVLSGTEVVCACLNQDYLGRPFGITPRLLAIADNIVHVKAVCVDCGRKDAATRTFRHSGGLGQVEIGGIDKYKAMCRGCWAAAREAQTLQPELAVA